MSNYPNSIYSPRTKENKAGVVYDESKKTVGYAEDVTKLDDEVIAIEEELGTDPKGDYDNVKDRIIATESAWQSLTEGTLINGKISVSVISNNITVALKTKSGDDPSTSNPVYVVLEGAIRKITSALSVTKNAGTNWFRSGASILAAQEIDYFVYLGYNNDDGVVIGFARVPWGKCYNDFSTTTTDETYCAISTITNAVSTDYYSVIGRFAASLSASANYYWSVPSFTAINLIQRPIYETRSLIWAPNRHEYAGVAPTYTAIDRSQYSLSGNKVNWSIIWKNVVNGTSGSGGSGLYFYLPIMPKDSSSVVAGLVQYYESGGTCGVGTIIFGHIPTDSFVTIFLFTGLGILVGNDQSSVVRGIFGTSSYFSK
jgi:hypothetical protein